MRERLTPRCTPGEDRRMMLAHLLGMILSMFGLVGAAVPPSGADIPAVDVVVVVENLGEIRIRIDRSAAPNHAAHFLSLAAAGRYDGTEFHRIIPGFLVQAGKEPSRESGSRRPAPRTRIPEERSSLSASRGSVAIAWQGCTPGTGDREWYICLADLPRLDHCGTFIGKVVGGMDVVDKIAQVSTTPQWNPLRPVIIEEMKLVSAADPVRAVGSKPTSARDSSETSIEEESPTRRIK